METKGLNYCDKCSIYVDGALIHCPLCRTHITHTPVANAMYPDVVQKKHIDRRSIVNDLLLFYAFLFIGGSSLLNLIFWRGTPWLIAVIAAVMYVWMIFRVIIISDLFQGAKAFFHILGIMGMMLAFDYVSGWYGWSYEIVLPLVLTAGLIYIDIFAWIHKTLWRDSVIYAVLFIGLCFIPLALYISDIIHVLTPMLLSSIAGALTILGVIRFAVRRFSAEMKKRFHV